MSTQNKRISQLIELTSPEVEGNDLLLIVDSTANESKKIQVSEFGNWLNASTSFHIYNADTASYILGSNVNGIVNSSSYSITSSFCNSSIQSNTSITSSYAGTASYVINEPTVSPTSSYIEYAGFPNGTASYALSTALSNTSANTNFLNYFGGNNGTASFSINTGNTIHAVNADTASYFNNTLTVVASASHANISDTIVGNIVPTASFLLFSNSNGTASYAIQAGSVQGMLNNYGLVNAYQQSISSSIINTLIVSSSLGIQQPTIIEIIGDAILYFTSSHITNYSLSLFTINRLTGQSNVIDNSYIGLNSTPITNNWGGLQSGSMNIPINLIGEVSLFGEYFLELTSSSPYLTINPNRQTKFILQSQSDVLNTQTDEPITFLINPTASVIINFSSSLISGSVIDFLPGLLITGSKNITWIDVNNKSVTDIKYIWQCTELTHLICPNNSSLQALGYSFPSTLNYLDCNSCIIGYINDLTNTAVTHFDCSNNNLSVLPAMSPSTTYLNCGNNPITYLANLPNSLLSLYAQSSSVSQLALPGNTPSLPNNLITASFAGTPLLFLPTSLPTSMSYLDISNTNTFSMPDPPISMSFLNLRNTFLNMSALETVSGILVSNAQFFGTFDLRGYGPISSFSPTLSSNILLLSTNNWTVLYDL